MPCEANPAPSRLVPSPETFRFFAEDSFLINEEATRHSAAYLGYMQLPEAPPFCDPMAVDEGSCLSHALHLLSWLQPHLFTLSAACSGVLIDPHSIIA
jgi:hypothetical protein